MLRTYSCIFFVLVLLWFIISANTSVKCKKGERKHSGRVMSLNKHQSWRLWIHDEDRSDADASLRTSGWSTNVPSGSIDQRGRLHQTRDPGKGGNTPAAEQKKMPSNVCHDVRGLNQWPLHHWVNHAPGAAGMCLHVFPSVPCHQNSIGLLMFPLRTDQGSYINQIYSFLERPDAHISTITCEMMLGAVGGSVSAQSEQRTGGRWTIAHRQTHTLHLECLCNEHLAPGRDDENKHIRSHRGTSSFRLFWIIPLFFLSKLP